MRSGALKTRVVETGQLTAVTFTRRVRCGF